jgi:NTP pyrophosphatase (non-canonical NTP hydrolase)
VNNLNNSTDKIKVEEEIADVGNYLLLLCNQLNINLFDAIEKKMIKNAKKYPIEKCKGKSTKYNKL